MALEQIGPYRILGLIGSGGMGDVLLAEDSRLGRRVAIKRVRANAVDPHAHRRLLAEAQAVAQLDHPNICSIYEAGEDERGPYLVMPFVEGETLAARLARGPLPLDEATAMAEQIGEALAAAHSNGILHRDIKPANVIIGTRGLARVMDFGLAKFTGASGSQETLETASALTSFGTTLGTAAYMSPEQARGEVVDARSDLFSLGVVMHEMITGQRPFGGSSAAETIAALLGSNPAPVTRLRPETSDALQRIVSKLLQKNREERYQSAADLLVDLRALRRDARIQSGAAVTGAHPAQPAAPLPSKQSRRGLLAGLLAVLAIAAAGYWIWSVQSASPSATAAAVTPPITSLAVLPLTNVSPDPAQDYFAAAMTEELTRALSGITSLSVVSRTSSAQFRNSTRTMPEIARALGVDALIEGSIVRDGRQVRITTALIDGSTARHVWSRSYDGELRDMLDLQRRVAEAIALEVRATVKPEEQRSLQARRQIDPVAGDLYLKGRDLWYRGTSTPAGFVPDLLKQAIGTFEAAIKIEPEWAEPRAGLAMCQHWLATSGDNPHVRFPASREAAIEAIRLDDRMADAHGSLAYVSFTYDYDLERSEREYRRAVDLGAAASHSMGFAKLLQALGRFDEARTMMDLAVSRNPLSAVARMEAAQLSLATRRYDEAIRRARDVPATVGDTGRVITGLALQWKGQYAEALAELKDLSSPAGAAAYASALARAGRTAEARARLRVFEREAGSGEAYVQLASIYASLGDEDKAIGALERALEAKTIWLPLINVNQSFEALHGTPRFENLLRRVGIPKSQ